VRTPFVQRLTELHASYKHMNKGNQVTDVLVFTGQTWSRSLRLRQAFTAVSGIPFNGVGGPTRS